MHVKGDITVIPNQAGGGGGGGGAPLVHYKAFIGLTNFVLNLERSLISKTITPTTDAICIESTFRVDSQWVTNPATPPNEQPVLEYECEVGGVKLHLAQGGLLDGNDGWFFGGIGAPTSVVSRRSTPSYMACAQVVPGVPILIDMVGIFRDSIPGSTAFASLPWANLKITEISLAQFDIVIPG